jgi:hypothetical protein
LQKAQHAHAPPPPQIRDTATDVPAGYTPPDFFSRALQHTDPTLTWDETDRGRKKVRAAARLRARVRGAFCARVCMRYGELAVPRSFQDRSASWQPFCTRSHTWDSSCAWRPFGDV